MGVSKSEVAEEHLQEQVRVPLATSQADEVS
jgi:hypothetical protein